MIPISLFSSICEDILVVGLFSMCLNFFIVKTEESLEEIINTTCYLELSFM